MVFLIGDPALKMPRRDGPLLYLPCPDDYHSLPQKTRWFCLWALAHTDCRQFFKVDDDTYVRVDRLLAALAAGQWSEPIVGCKDGNGDHFHGGAGYLLHARCGTVDCGPPDRRHRLGGLEGPRCRRCRRHVVRTR